SMYHDESTEMPPGILNTAGELPDAFIQAMQGGTSRFSGWRVDEHGVDALRSRLTKVRALVRHIDDTVGRLLELFPLDRTAIAFTSDHGDYAGHRGLAGKVPWIPFDDLVRIPLILAGAGIVSG